MGPASVLMYIISCAFYSMLRFRRVGHLKRGLITLILSLPAMAMLFAAVCYGSSTIYKYLDVVDFTMGILILFLIDHKCDCCERRSNLPQRPARQAEH